MCFAEFCDSVGNGVIGVAIDLYLEQLVGYYAVLNLGYYAVQYLGYYVVLFLGCYVNYK